MKQGAVAILPLAIGVVIYGFAFGLLAAQIGFSWWSVGLMSVAVHAGSSQIVAVEQFSAFVSSVGCSTSRRGTEPPLHRDHWVAVSVTR